MYTVAGTCYYVRALSRNLHSISYTESQCTAAPGDKARTNGCKQSRSIIYARKHTHTPTRHTCLYVCVQAPYNIMQPNFYLTKLAPYAWQIRNREIFNKNLFCLTFLTDESIAYVLYVLSWLNETIFVMFGSIICGEIKFRKPRADERLSTQLDYHEESIIISNRF